MANAIIFVAPISAFDQYLEEDPRINRIDDSLQLFTQICANSLLKKVHLVLFLSNCCPYRSGAYVLTRLLPQIKQTSCGQSSPKDRRSTSSAYIHISVSGSFTEDSFAVFSPLANVKTSTKLLSNTFVPTFSKSIDEITRIVACCTHI